MLQAIHLSLTCCSQTVSWGLSCAKALWPLFLITLLDGQRVKHETLSISERAREQTTGHWAETKEKSTKNDNKEALETSCRVETGSAGDRGEGRAIGCNRL